MGFMDLLAFQAEFWNCGSVTGRQYILVSLEKNQNNAIQTEGGVAFQRNLELFEFRAESWNSGYA